MDDRAAEVTPRDRSAGFVGAHPASRYALAFVAVGVMVVVRSLLDPIFGATRTPFLLFVPAVMVSAWCGGLFPGLLSTALALVSADAWLLGGAATTVSSSSELALDHFLFLLIGILISSLCEGLRAQRRQAEGVAAQRLELLQEKTRAEAVLRALDQERRTALAETERARHDAEEASRLKDEFLAVVSHELRNPLNAIVGWAHVLAARAEDSEAEAVAAILRSAEAQRRLIEDLLDMSRILSGKLSLTRERVDLGRLVEATVAVLSPAAQAKGLHLGIRHGEAGGIIVEADAARLDQAMRGLLGNAVKFTPAGGRVDVAVRRVGPDAEIVVSDTGAGIAAEVLPHVFERFSQADGSSRRAHEGLGLGLALVHELIALHGGSVRAESAGPAQGATFAVRIPALAADAAAGSVRAAAVEDAATTAPLDGVRVLVVEDDADSRAMMNRLLSGQGARVETAGSAAEGLSRLPRFHPHVLVSDIGMPGEDGYDLIRRVRALRPEHGGRTPAVALTAFARSADWRRALGAGFESYLAKPVAASDLVHTVADLAERMRR